MHFYLNTLECVHQSLLSMHSGQIEISRQNAYNMHEQTTKELVYALGTGRT